MATGPFILVEETDNVLRCIARPRFPMATLSVAAVIVLFVSVLGWHIISVFFEQMGPADVGMRFELLLVLAWVGLFIAMNWVIVTLVRRQRAQNGIVIEQEMVQVFTPERARKAYRFPQGELAGAELSKSTRQLRLVGLTIRRRHGWSIQFLTGYPVAELVTVMDAINRKVIEDRVAGFPVTIAPPENPAESPRAQ